MAESASVEKRENFIYLINLFLGLFVVVVFPAVFLFIGTIRCLYTRVSVRLLDTRCDLANTLTAVPGWLWWGNLIRFDEN